MKVSALIEDAKRYVVGYYEDDGEQYVHWTEEDWLSYVKMAVGIIGMVDQDLFTTTVDVDLRPGSVQDIPAPCQSLRTVRGQRNKDGAVDHIIRKRSMSSMKLPSINRPVCRVSTATTGDYKVKSYTIDPDDPKMVIVDPPVPDGVTATMVVTCYAPPKMESLEEDLPINDTHSAIVFELILYYAWGVDIEDQANRERSNKHWDNALKLMEINDKATVERLKRLATKAMTNG